MDIYPVDEQRISDVERGRSSDAIVPLVPGKALAAGDSILFALAHPKTEPGAEPRYVIGGDSVRVLITDVTDLDVKDSATGHPLMQISWEPLGAWTPTPSTPRNRKVRVS